MCNYIPFTVCWPCDSYRNFKEALNCVQSPTQLLNQRLGFSQRRSETWQALRRFTLDDGSLRNETTCGVSSFHSFRSAGCVSWRVSQRSFPSITCVCELMGQLVDSSPGSRSVTIGDCLNGSVSDGQSTLSLCWQWGEQQVGNQQGACVQTNMNISTVQDQTSKKAVFLNQGS